MQRRINRPSALLLPGAGPQRVPDALTPASPVCCGPWWNRDMLHGKPSRTAQRVALRRAAHQVFDRPVVFPDPLALRILGLSETSNLQAAGLRAPGRPHSVSLRAFLVARSRFAEDALAAAVRDRGVQQYVLLGAGLDTFAYRNPHEHLSVFEVDHPATQAWKLDLLSQNGIAIPSTARHSAVDFQRDSLRDRLAASSFREDRPAVFAWLGVVPYLTDEGFESTLRFLSGCASGSVLVLDYGLPREALPPLEQLALDSMSARVAAAGEPFQLFFLPDDLHRRLETCGWRVLDDLDRVELNARYFADSNLHVLGSGARLLRAELR